MTTKGQQSNTQEDAGKACWRRIGVWSSESPSCPELTRVSHCHNCDVFKQAAAGISADAIPETNNKDHTSEGDWSLVPFRMGSVWLSLPSSNIITLASVQEVHSIPRRSNIVLHGIVTVQNEIYVSVSLSKLMGLNREESAQPDYARGVFERMVIAWIGNVRVAFKVDEVRGVTRIFKKDCIDTQHEFTAPIDQFVQCCFALHEDKPVVCGVINEESLSAELHTVLE